MKMLAGKVTGWSGMPTSKLICVRHTMACFTKCYFFIVCYSVYYTVFSVRQKKAIVRRDKI